jgi:hypothetical protein
MRGGGGGPCRFFYDLLLAFFLGVPLHESQKNTEADPQKPQKPLVSASTAGSPRTSVPFVLSPASLF